MVLLVDCYGNVGGEEVLDEGKEGVLGRGPEVVRLEVKFERE